MIIHRIFSWFLIVVLIVPLWIIMGLLQSVFRIINGFHYHNFWSIEVPQMIYDRLGENVTVEIITRILMILMDAFNDFKRHFKELKNIKF